MPDEPEIPYMSRIRQALGLSQREVAEHLGITESAVSQAEAGRASLRYRNVRKAAEMMCCLTEDFDREPSSQRLNEICAAYYERKVARLRGQAEAV